MRTSWSSPKKNVPTKPCLIIIESCYFDCRISKHFTCSRCVICVTCAKDHRLFYLNYPQINEVGISDHVVHTWYTRANRCSASCDRCAALYRTRTSLWLMTTWPAWSVLCICSLWKSCLAGMGKVSPHPAIRRGTLCQSWIHLWERWVCSFIWARRALKRPHHSHHSVLLTSKQLALLKQSPPRSTFIGGKREF